MKEYIFIGGAFLLLVPMLALAEVKDSDADGLTDEGEVKMYQTNPNRYDTDGDGIGDGEEVLDGTNPLEMNDSRIAELTDINLGFFGESQKFAWYIARVSGIVAFILFSLVAIYGLLVSNARLFIKWVSPPTALSFHRYLSFLALSVLLLHVGSFFFDHYLNLTIPEMFIPFLVQRNFTSVLGFDLGYSIALGIIAFYIFVVLIVTAEFRRKIFARTWRKLHYLSFIGYLLFVIHGFTVGSDSETWWMRGMYSVSVIIVLSLLVVRIVSSITLTQKKKQIHIEDPLR